MKSVVRSTVVVAGAQHSTAQGRWVWLGLAGVFVVLMLVIPIPGMNFGAMQSRLFPEADYTGTVEAKRLLLGSLASGRVISVHVHEGEVVEKGQLLLSLDKRRYDIGVLKARARLASSEAKLNRSREGARPQELSAMAARVQAAKAHYESLVADAPVVKLAQILAEIRELQELLDYYDAQRHRIERLAASGTESQAALDLAKKNQLQHRRKLENVRYKLEALRQGATEEQRDESRQKYLAAKSEYDLLLSGESEDAIRIAEARVALARAELMEANLALSHTELRATTKGRIEFLLVEQGAIVGEGDPLVSLLRDHHPFVDIYVPAPKIADISVGQKVLLRLETTNEESVNGRVSWIAAGGEFTPRNVFTPKQRLRYVHKVRVDILQPSPGLKPGVYARQIHLLSN